MKVTYVIYILVLVKIYYNKTKKTKLKSENKNVCRKPEKINSKQIN